MTVAQLWGGRFTKQTDELVYAFNQSLKFDRRLFNQDIRGSKAHAEMLAKQGILTDEEKNLIVGGLDALKAKVDSGELKIEGNIDTMKTGVQTVNFTVSGEDEKYGQYAEKKYSASAEVVDTQFPSIEIEKETLTVTEGTQLNVMPNITAVTDPVDGQLPEGDGVTASYTAVSDLNTNKPGKYTVTVTAADKNGNQTTRDFAVTVKEKPKPVVTASAKVSANTSGNYSTIYSYVTGTMGLNKAAACGILITRTLS